MGGGLSIIQISGPGGLEKGESITPLKSSLLALGQEVQPEEEGCDGPRQVSVAAPRRAPQLLICPGEAATADPELSGTPGAKPGQGLQLTPFQFPPSPAGRSPMAIRGHSQPKLGFEQIRKRQLFLRGAQPYTRANTQQAEPRAGSQLPLAAPLDPQPCGQTVSCPWLL